jgi:hypothetical protein
VYAVSVRKTSLTDDGIKDRQLDAVNRWGLQRADSVGRSIIGGPGDIRD